MKNTALQQLQELDLNYFTLKGGLIQVHYDLQVLT